MKAIKLENEELKRLVTNIEKLEAEKQETIQVISKMYKEAGRQGFNPKIIRKLIKLRKRDKVELQEENYLLGIYAGSLQMELF